MLAYSGPQQQQKTSVHQWRWDRRVQEPMRTWGPKPILLLAWGRDNAAHNELVMDACDDFLDGSGASVACLDLLQHMKCDPGQSLPWRDRN